MGGRAGFYLLVGAYLAGLLVAGWSWGWLLLGMLAVIGGFLSFQLFWLPSWRVWIAAGLLAVFASPYLHLRTPLPGSKDISWLAPQHEITLLGTVTETLHQGEDFQSFYLRIEPSSQEGLASYTGTAFVRAPAQPALRPGSRVRLNGALYQSPGRINPGQFAFDDYLRRRGVFAHIQARTLVALGRPEPDWLWMIRQRVLQIHQRALGAERGALMTSLVLGNGAVELPKPIQQRYTEAGLAHLLAASGAQVSLLLGTSLGLVARQSPRLKVSLAGVTLLVYICLAGGSPAVLRAGVMGGVTLLGLARGHQAAPLSALLLAVGVLLIYNPLWITDLGFGYSFLATAGLVVTAPRLAKGLDFLPPVLATPLAVALAAGLWTLPLQLLHFGQLSPYAVPLNVLVVPAVEVLTLGGLATSVLGLAHLGLAWPGHVLLGWILGVLDSLVGWVNTLPGSLMYPGTLLPVQVILLYSLLAASCWTRPWPLLGLAGVVLVVPLLLAPSDVSLSVLAGGGAEVLVIENGRQTLVVNGGDVRACERVLLPHLQQRGRLHLSGVITTGTRETQTAGLATLLALSETETLWDGADLPWQTSYRAVLKGLTQQGTAYRRLSPAMPIPLGSGLQILVLSTEPTVLLLRTPTQQVLLLGRLSPLEQEWFTQTYADSLSGVQALWTSAPRLNERLLALPGLRNVIVSGRGLDAAAERELTERDISYWTTARHGGLVWRTSGRDGQLTPTRR